MRFPKPTTEVCLSVMQKPEELLENRSALQSVQAVDEEGRDSALIASSAFSLIFTKGILARSPLSVNEKVLFMAKIREKLIQHTIIKIAHYKKVWFV